MNGNGMVELDGMTVDLVEQLHVVGKRFVDDPTKITRRVGEKAIVSRLRIVHSCGQRLS